VTKTAFEFWQPSVYNHNIDKTVGMIQKYQTERPIYQIHHGGISGQCCVGCVGFKQEVQPRFRFTQ
jgi:hypothetical protein